MEAVEPLYQEEQDGVLVLLEIQKFSKIDEQYGLVFGDIILEQLSQLMAERFQKEGLNNGIYIRAGADQLLVWLPGRVSNLLEESIQGLSEEFARFTDEKYLTLSLKCASAVTDRENVPEAALEHAKVALTAARHGNKTYVSYDSLTPEEKNAASEISFYAVASVERLKEMNLSSIALNLFDREGKASVILDILALELKEKYHLTNILVTDFNREYLTNDQIYCWKKEDRKDGWNGMVQCPEREYQHFIRSQELQKLTVPSVGFVLCIRERGIPGIRFFLMGSGAPLFLAFLFVFGMLGAGDIKLFCALGSVMGFSEILKCICISFMIGACISLAILISEHNFCERIRYFISYLILFLKSYHICI